MPCTLHTGGASYYLPLVFPRQEPELRPYLTLKSQQPERRAAWRDAFLWFMQKVGDGLEGEPYYENNTA